MWLAVAAGGAVGALARALVEAAFVASSPWPTAAINILGSLLLGLLAGSLFARPTTPRWLSAGLGTGLLGGFTTMSALAVQSLALVGSGSALLAASYIALSVTLGLAAAWLGIRLGSGRAKAAA